MDLGQLVEVSKDKENSTTKKPMVQVDTSKDDINPSKKRKDLGPSWVPSIYKFVILCPCTPRVSNLRSLHPLS